MLLLWLLTPHKALRAEPRQQGAPSGQAWQEGTGSRAELPKRRGQQGHPWVNLTQNNKGLLPYRCQHSHEQCHPTQGTASGTAAPPVPPRFTDTERSALPVTLQFRGTPSFFMSILHKTDASSPFSNTKLYESLHFPLLFFFPFLLGKPHLFDFCLQLTIAPSP